MAQASGNFSQYTLSRGKVTEVTELTSPEESARVLNNMELTPEGRVQRRLGVEYESGRLFGSIVSVKNAPIHSYEWKNANGKAFQDFIVLQVGTTLYFYKTNVAAISANLITTKGLASYRADPSLPIGCMEFASGQGALFCVAQNMNPIYIEYDPDTNDFTITEITIKVRDFDGVDDGLNIDERPGTITKTHHYNLLNQGWPAEFLLSTEAKNPSTIEGSSITTGNPINHTKSKLGVYPSNADYIYIARRSFPNGMQPYEPFKLQEVALGNSRAPSGHFILDAFDKDRNGVAGTLGTFSGGTSLNSSILALLGITSFVNVPTSGNNIPSETTNNRPQGVAFFAGRVFYGGQDTEGSTVVYFSQVLSDLKKAGRCYQDQDPTAEQLNTVLATDGGSIQINDAGTILRMLPLRNGILVFAVNGVWLIAGNAETGFSATDFSVSFIGKVGALGTNSIIRTDDGVLFWADQGIYAVGENESGQVSLRNISSETIQNDYLAISKNSRIHALGFYDEDNQRVGWCYNDNAVDGSKNVHFTNKILWFDINLGAFFDYTIQDGSGYPYVTGVIRNAGFGADGTMDLTLNDETTAVTDNSTTTLTITSPDSNSIDSTIKLVTAKPAPAGGNLYQFTFSEFRGTTFLDWEEETGGDDADAEIELAPMTFGEAARDKQVQHILVHFDRTEQNWTLSGNDLVLDKQSSALLQVKYDFTDTSTANRWADQVQAYRLKRVNTPAGAGPFDYSFKVITCKLRARGHGRGITINLKTEAGKDLRFIGYDLAYSGRTKV